MALEAYLKPAQLKYNNNTNIFLININDLENDIKISSRYIMLQNIQFNLLKINSK